MQYIEVDRIQPSLSLAFHYLERRLPEIEYNKGSIHITGSHAQLGQKVYTFRAKGPGVWVLEDYENPRTFNRNELIAFIRSIPNIIWMYFSSAKRNEIEILWDTRRGKQPLYGGYQASQSKEPLRPSYQPSYRPTMSQRPSYQPRTGSPRVPYEPVRPRPPSGQIQLPLSRQSPETRTTRPELDLATLSSSGRSSTIPYQSIRSRQLQLPPSWKNKPSDGFKDKADEFEEVEDVRMEWLTPDRVSDTRGFNKRYYSTNGSNSRRTRSTNFWN